MLADELTVLVHGEAALAGARALGELLFSGRVGELDEAQLRQLAGGGLPTTSWQGEGDLVALLVVTGLAGSKRIARELLTAGAIMVNGRLVEENELAETDWRFGRFLLLRRGKKQYHLVQRS
ncbi:Tyrosine--tRNA ligase [compost metagenome]